MKMIYLDGKNSFENLLVDVFFAGQENIESYRYIRQFPKDGHYFFFNDGVLKISF